MRISPAKKHFQHAQAAQRQSIESPVRADATAYELMLAKLAEDRRRLHDVQSIERRAEVKRELLPDYEAWVGGALEGDHGVQDDVLMTIMVWRIDVGDLSGALQIAAYAIKHKLAMPDQYKRSTGCLIAEEFADYALRLDAIAPETTGRLQDANELTANEDMPDQVRAKLLKAIGHGLLQTADVVDQENRPAYLQSALDHFKHAIGLHEKVGVKKDIERLEREIKNSGVASGGA